MSPEGITSCIACKGTGGREDMSICLNCGGAGWERVKVKYPEVPTYFRTPEEHVAALMDTTIRALEQLWTLRYVKDRQPLEEDLAFVEAVMKRLRKDVLA